MAKKNYWDYNQEDMVYRWTQANTIQQFKIYDELYKSVRHMAATILGRYFMYSPDNKEIMQDAINHLFCVMHKFDPERGKTAYAFCQTVLKNYYHEVARNKKGRKFAVVLEYYDDLEAPEFNYSYEWQPYEEEHNFNPVFKRLEGARYKLLCYLKDHKKLPNNQRNSIQHEVDFLSITTEFLHKYKDAQGLNGISIAENAMLHTGLSQTTIGFYTNKHLGFYSYLNKKDSKIEAKYGFHYMEDDFTPDASDLSKNRVRRINYKNKQLYNE